jgi:hypothetical protein
MYGGYDAGGSPVCEMEVFDSQALTMSKVLDGQNTWVQIPFQSYRKHHTLAQLG